MAVTKCLTKHFKKRIVKSYNKKTPMHHPAYTVVKIICNCKNNKNYMLNFQFKKNLVHFLHYWQHLKFPGSSGILTCTNEFPDRSSTNPQ